MNSCESACYRMKRSVQDILCVVRMDIYFKITFCDRKNNRVNCDLWAQNNIYKKLYFV